MNDYRRHQQSHIPSHISINFPIYSKAQGNLFFNSSSKIFTKNSVQTTIILSMLKISQNFEKNSRISSLCLPISTRHETMLTTGSSSTLPTRRTSPTNPPKPKLTPMEPLFFYTPHKTPNPVPYPGYKGP